MDNIIVADFKNERSAMTGLDRLTELDRRGEVLVYNEVLIRRTSEFYSDVLEKQADTPGWQAASGMAIGGFAGIFGGPVGAVAGMMAGAAVGAAADVFRYSFDEAFVEKATGKIPVGSTAIIAEVGESDVRVIDRRLGPLATEIWRSGIYAEHRKLARSRIEALKAKIKATEKAVRQARADDMAAIKAGLAHKRDQLDALFSDIDNTILKKEMAEDKATLGAVRSELKFELEGKQMHRVSEKVLKYKNKIAEDKAELEQLNSNRKRAKGAGAK